MSVQNLSFFQLKGKKVEVNWSFQWTNLLLLDIVKYILIIKSGAAQKIGRNKTRKGPKGGAIGIFLLFST